MAAPRGQGGFRPGEDIAAPPATQDATFTRAADAGGTDRDVLMGYQMFLGRDPESSFVIADAKTSPVGAFVRALLGSGEFQSAVLDRLAAGRPLPHENAGPAPTPGQVAWLFGLLRVPPRAEAALRAATGWAEWLRTLLAISGLPTAPPRAAGRAEGGPEAQAASEGFVLITIEQPKAGERLLPGAVVQGSGWAIAPADIAEVAVELDGRLLTHARYGLPRPDVARGFPHYRHVDHCGFSFSAEIPDDASAAALLSVSVRTGDGQTGRKSVRLQTPAAAGPAVSPQAGAAETAWPIRLAVEDAVVDASRTLRVRGWAISAEPMRAVSVTLGGTALGEARHGLPRPDIGSAHPSYANAAASGFALVAQLDADLPAGPGFVRVQAADQAGHTRQTIVPVTLPGAGREPEPGPGSEPESEPGPRSEPEPGPGPASGPGQASGPTSAISPASPRKAPAGMRLEVDHPALSGDAARDPVRGAITISGWAAARAGVAQVRVFADARLLGQAHLGMRREDIGAAFPEYKGALLAGYALVLPPGSLPEGSHTIRVVADAQSDDPAGDRAGGPAGDQRADAGGVERRFTLHVERYDALPPDGTIRIAVPPAEAAFGLGLLARQGYAPGFEVVVAGATGGAAGLAALEATLRSLHGQVLTGWTAVVTLPDAAGLRAARALPAAADALGRIRLARAGAAPRRRAAAPGDAARPSFTMMLRAGDRLGADALLELACESAADRAADFIYADELRPDPGQGRRQPFFKPEWSPDLLLAMNYVGRPWCASAALLARAGLDAAGLEAGSDYAAVLGLSEQAQRVAHVARVLCERGEAADTADAEAAALAAALARRSVAASVEPGAVAGTWRVRRNLARRAPPGARRPPPVAGLVSIIMPTCGAGGLVRRAIASIRATSAPARRGGPKVEVIILDNTPVRETEMRAWLRGHADIVIDMPGAFNWSRFNNVGARAAAGDYLLFLNDDVETAQPDWLDALLEHAQRPEVGVVGARLLYPNGSVQHGGQYLADTHARHAFRFADAATPGPFGMACVAREMISVTGACQMVRARVFAELGGFEEAHDVVNNDLDFCLRSWRAGLRVMFTPHATLTHHELASRAALEDSYDEQRFVGAWRTRFLAGDPYRSPRLGADADHYGADPEPPVRLHAGRRGTPADAVARILAVKLDHIGDFLTALPALRSLRRRFPAASIDLLAPAASAELARHEPSVSRTIVFDFFHARSGLGQKGVGRAEFEALRSRLAPEGYDIAIDLRMQPETRAVLPYTGARFLAGYDHDGRFGFLDVALGWEGDERLVAKRAHVSERLVQLVSATEDACRSEAVPPPAPRLAPADVPALAALPAAFLARPIVCVHPGVGNVVRQWPVAHYAALIDLLAGAGLHVVLVGAPEEAAIAEDVLRRVTSQGAAESLVGRARLGALGDIMRACVLFVGNNSGPQHLAASLGMPAIGIHSGVVDAAEWAPLGSQAMALRRRMICSPCYLEFASDCPRDLACLTGLRPSDVFAACRRMLGGAGSAQG